MIPESLRLFNFCENTKWSVLPVAGGIYDQHPQLIAEWETIFHIRAVVEKRKAAEQERKARKKK